MNISLRTELSDASMLLGLMHVSLGVHHIHLHIDSITPVFSFGDVDCRLFQRHHPFREALLHYTEAASRAAGRTIGNSQPIFCAVS